MLKQPGILLLLFLLPMLGMAQLPSDFHFNDSITVLKDGSAMMAPFSGGLNNPQFSDIDLNRDGKQDLFIFDRFQDKVLTYINEGNAGETDYSFAPGYEDWFPEDLIEWVLLVDYNNDGLEDIFTSWLQSIRLYKAVLNNDKIEYEIQEDILLYEGNSGFPVNIYVGSPDIPAIIDINNDGDIDVLTFDQNSGAIEYYENQSIEDGNPYDSLFFQLVDPCWGQVLEDPNLPDISLNISCKSGDSDASAVAQLHPGSTVLAFDRDGDIDKEALIGDISSIGMQMLYNAGNPDIAFIDSLDATFPSYNISIDVYNFPAAFYLDINNDNLNDLLVAPNQPASTENFEQVRHYQNIGTANDVVFNFVENDFLVKDMIDVGTAAYPKLVDVDNDGLEDLLIGNNGYFNRSDTMMYSTLTLYKNTSTEDAIQFTFESSDAFQLSSFNFNGLYPAFADLDQDGDEDMIAGDEDGWLHYFENIAPAGADMDLSLVSARIDSINVGTRAVPSFYDQNGDDLVDLIVGERAGTINLILNTSTNNEVHFELVDNFWLDVNVQEPPLPIGFSSPLVVQLDSTDTDYLLVHNYLGSVFLYDETNTGTANLLASNFVSFNTGGTGGIDIGDINNDQYRDMVIGNDRGGVVIVTQNEMFAIDSPIIVMPTVPNIPEFELALFPNPAAENLWIICDEPQGSVFQFVVYNEKGQVVMEADKYRSGEIVSLQSLSSGLYYLQMKNENHYFSSQPFLKL